MANPFLAQTLAGLSQGLMAAGSGGWQNFAPGFSQGLMGAQNQYTDQLDRAERQRMRQLQEQLLQNQLEQQRTANQDAVKQQQQWEGLFQPGMMAPPSPDFVGPMPQGGEPLVAGLMEGASPQALEFLKTLGPQAGGGILAEKVFSDQDPDAPKTVGGMMWDGQSFVPIPGYTEQAKAIATAGRTPAQPRASQIITLYDPTGKPKSMYDSDPAVPQMLQEGWTEAAPKSGSVLAQVGTDANGQPIFDYVAQAPKMTEDQSKAMNFASRMEASAPIIDQFESQGTDLGAKFRSAIPILGNYGQSKDYQQYSQAKDDFMRAVLRKESGAVISDEEMAGGDRQYFPQPGDGPDVIAQKRQNRRVALEAMKSAAGPGAQLIPGIVSRSTGPTQDPQSLNQKYGPPQ